MTHRQILIHPDPRLRKVVPEIAEITPDVKALAEEMLSTMYDAPGIGLAGPQIGAMHRIFVMDCNRDEPGASPTVCINPVVVAKADSIVTTEEGCLSIPEFYADVKRPEAITLRYLDLDGQTQEQRLEEQWAICAQHELDHLNGKLFIDYLGPVTRQMVTRKMKKLKKDRARG